MFTLDAYLVSILLCLQHLVSKLQVLCNKLSTLLFLLLDLAHEVLDNGFLGL